MTKTIPSREQLVAALDSPDPNHPLARAVAAALQSYAAMLDAAARRSAGWPNPLIVPAPRDEIEAFALELFTHELAAQGLRIQIKGDS